MPFDELKHADTLVQVDQIRAASHEDMLAVVEHLARTGIDKAGRPPAQTLAGFDENGMTVRFNKTHRRGDTRQPAPDDGDTLAHGAPFFAFKMRHLA